MGREQTDVVRQELKQVIRPEQKNVMQ
jgi:hypothetical protein